MADSVKQIKSANSVICSISRCNVRYCTPHQIFPLIEVQCAQKKEHPNVVFELFNLAVVEVVSELVLQTHFG